MSDLPKFNRTRGPAILSQSGPFDFSGVALRTFPLRADEACLKAFVKEHLDLGDEDVVRYEVALPYVFLSFVNYGMMSGEAARVGVWSQFEVVFQIPLEWYVRDGDGWVFHDWALLTPYILVDDPTSIATGREVYGWPKERGWISPELDPWRRDHSDAQRLISLRARTFSPAFQGMRMVRRPLVNVEHTPTPLTAQLPPDPRLIPFYLIPRAIVGSLGTLGMVAEGASRMVFGGSPSGPRKRLDILLGDLFDLLVRSRPDASVNLVNLKQFRDSADPLHACYQALVNARMAVTGCRGAGLLGDVELARGNQSGGYEIAIHRYDQRPIVERLGLHVASSRETDTGTVDTLRPQLPFWADLDLHYELGKTLCWRAGTPRWSEGTGAHLPPQVGDKREATYREVAGASVAKAPPFRFDDVTSRVFALKAKADKLQQFCDKYLNDEAPPEVGTFTPVLPLVFMFVNNFENIPGDLHDAGRWADHEFMFAVPAIWKRVVDGNTKEDIVLVSPYLYANSSIAIATGREVSGWPTVKCELKRSEDAWLHKEGPLKPRLLAEMRAGVFKRLYAGEREEPRVLLTIAQDQQPGSPPLCLEEMAFRDWIEPLLSNSIEQAVQTSPDWGRGLLLPLPPGRLPSWAEIRTWPDDARGAMVREVTKLQGNEMSVEAIEQMVDWLESVYEAGSPLRFVNLKQFRDSAEPDHACYQAILLVEHVIDNLSAGPLALDPDRHGASFDIRIRAFPNEPIVETLGLDAVETPVPGGAGETEYALTTPTHPFWVEVGFTEDGAQKLCSRARTKTWTVQ